MSTEVHGRRRVWRWVKRGVLGLLAFLVIAVAGVLITLHTDWGRELVRKQVEAQLNNTFIGGAKLGKLEGSPFGELVLRDLVINGPDNQQAIAVKTVRLEIELLPLLSSNANISSLVIEDPDIVAKRMADGSLQLAKLTKPSEKKSTWSVNIAGLEVHRGHLAYDTGKEIVNVDRFELAGAVKAPHEQPVEANVELSGTWRERATDVSVSTQLRAGKGVIDVAHLDVKAGEIIVDADKIYVETPEGETVPRRIEGTIAIKAPKADVVRLMPELEKQMPADVELRAVATTAAPWTNIKLDGKIGRDKITARLDADLVGKRAKGTLDTDRLDLGALSQGKVVGMAQTSIQFEATAPQPGMLPVGSALVKIDGDFEAAPDAKITLNASSSGERASAEIAVDGRSLEARINADLKKLGDAFQLERGRIVAHTTSPAASTGGKAPVRGRIDVDLTASGMVSPKPDLAVAGNISGAKLRMKDLRIGSLKLAIDARNLPAQPMGRMQLETRDIQQGTTYLRELDLNAANRADGKIQVSLRTRPKPNPYLFEADALVDPKAQVSPAGNTITIALQRHQVRAGKGAEWKGNTGFITIAPDRIELRDLTSKTDNGAVAAAGVFYRAGRRQGDLVAKIDLESFGLENLSKYYRGELNAHVDISRTNGRLAGSAELKASGISLDPRTLTYDADIKLDAAADKLVLAAKAGSLQLGSASVNLDIDAPKDIANAAAWQTLGRKAIRTGRIQLEGLDVAKIAELAKAPGYKGKIDGDIVMSSTTTGGVIQLRGLEAPALREFRNIDADLRIAQPEPDLLQPTLVARIADVGAVEAQATIEMPDRLFDPVAWGKLGRGALKGAYVRADNIELQPGVLDRAQIKTSIRGSVSVIAEITEAARSARLGVDVRNLRGGTINRPINVDLRAAIDHRATTATITAATKQTRLLDLEAHIPVTLAQLEADPQLAKAAPLKVTATIPDVPAPDLLATFGRREVTDGRVSGTIDVAGTVGKPTVRARIQGVGIDVPPGPRGKPIQTLERLAIDATWDGAAGKLVVDGVQKAGMLTLTAQGNPRALERATAKLEAKHFDLVPLLAFAPGPAGGAAGRLDANLTVTGFHPQTAKIAGELHLTDGRIPVAPNVGTLRNAKIDVVVKDDIQLAVDGLLGRGTVKGRGAIAMDGASPTGGEFNMTLRKISPIGVIEPIIDADVQTKLRKEPDRWVADVTVRNGVVKIPKDRGGEKLDPVGAPPDMRFMDGQRITERPMEKKPPAAPMFVANIRIYSTYIESKELRSLIKGKLTVTADGEAVGIVGGVEADRGDLDLFGRRYTVERAGVRFDGTPDPILDLRITHDFPEVTTITEVRGRASKPELVMSSNPGTYSQGQLLGFLLGGEPNGDPRQGSFTDAATSAGTSFIANKIGGYVKGALPIDLDVLKYESATSSSSAAIKVGTWLTRSLFVAYRRRLDARPDENTGEAQVEYWLSRRVFLEGTAGDRNRSGLDILWRRRY